MNPLNAFSFGKIIKTFIPGLMATGIVFAFVEYIAFRRSPRPRPAPGEPLWDFFLSHSLLLEKVTDPRVDLALLSALLPLALILGFFLNTLHWSAYHHVCWRRIEACLDPAYQRLRRRLESVAREAFREVAGDSAVKPPPVYLPGFLLPRIDLDKWTYLRESYFAWYEFQVNSVVALALSTLAYVALFTWIAVRWSVWTDYGVAVVIPSLAVAATLVGLHRSAMRNLRQYQERTLWYFVGCEWFEREAGPEPPSAGPEGRPRAGWLALAATALRLGLRVAGSIKRPASRP